MHFPTTTTLLLLLAPFTLVHSLALNARDDTTLAPSGSNDISPNPALVFKRQGNCSAGKVACGNGCIPSAPTNTCCTTYYCDSGRLCDTDGSCTCLSTEKKCGTGCIPLAASCCPQDLRYCDAGKYCSSVKGYCCNNGEDQAVCANRQGFTYIASAATASSTSVSRATAPTSILSTSTATPATSSSVRVSTSTSISRATTSTGVSVASTSSSLSASSSVAGSSSSDGVVSTVAASTTSARTSATFVTVPSNAAARVGGMDARVLVAGGFAGLVGLGL